MGGSEENRQEYTPRNNPVLMGHEAAEKILLDAWKNNSLHNSWLISGIEGIGKATLAYRFARFLLQNNDSRKDANSLDVLETSQTFRLVANDSHPDLKILERDFTETDRKKVLKAIKSGETMSDDEVKNLKKSTFIRVDDVRTINEFLSKRSSNDGWRVVIIDSIDDMNAASANAVLKILEEPPHKTVMLLISHNPGRLLPTIKSRCAKLNLLPLDETQLAGLIRRYRPGLSEKAIKDLTRICSGSIGKAISYADNNALETYEKLSVLAAAGKSFKLAELLAFCDQAAASEENYCLTQELVLKFIAEKIKSGGNVEALAENWEKAMKMFDEAERLNMDKKQVMQNIMYNLCKIN